ncbi:cation:proton antiporter [Streptomyces sp. NPDC057636]|uniref:cation:proton antiporter domain-containing protein n=1 Tax=Streptomyces sp. NPDC057636 TaxID=3346189 RepID=UPI0036A93644
MTTNQVLIGVGSILVLAVGSQILAGRLRIPALIVLLPVGFAAGVLIDDVDPEQLPGAAFSPLVSLAVAVILYDAGLGLDLARLKGHTRRVVVRLIWIGVLITGLLGTLLAAPLLGMSRQAAVMIGNALAAVLLRGSVEGTVHRLDAPADSHGVVAPFIGGEVLFDPDLTSQTFARRYEEGAAVLGQPAGDTLLPGSDLLFLVRRDGRLDPVTGGSTPLPRPGDTAVLLAPGRRDSGSPAQWTGRRLPAGLLRRTPSFPAGRTWDRVSPGPAHRCPRTSLARTPAAAVSP